MNLQVVAIAVNALDAIEKLKSLIRCAVTNPSSMNINVSINIKRVTLNLASYVDTV